MNDVGILEAKVGPGPGSLRVSQDVPCLSPFAQKRHMRILCLAPEMISVTR